MKIGNDLMEAYKGIYETQRELDIDGYKDHEDAIRTHSPKRRLETYLEWNGMGSWSSRIWELSQGEL